MLPAAKNTKRESITSSTEIEDENAVAKYRGAKHVGISYKINSLSDIDSVTCTFNINIKVAYTWEDPVLIGEEKGTIALDKIKGAFDPELEIINAYDLNEISSVTKLTKPKTGAIKRSVQYKGKCSMIDMDLTMFPFDAHSLQFMVKSHRIPIEQMIFVPDRTQSGAEYHPQHEWRNLSHCIKEYSTDPSVSSTNKAYSSVHIIALVQREGAWYVNNILIIAAALVMIALTTLAMVPSEQQGRMDVGILSFLAAITNKFIVAEKLPRIPYRTLIDIHLDIMFLLHLIVIISNVVVFDFTDDRTWGGLGKNLNMILFGICVWIFVSFHLWLGYTLREHSLDVEEWNTESRLTGETHENQRRGGSYFRPTGMKLMKLNSSRNLHGGDKGHNPGKSLDRGSNYRRGFLGDSSTRSLGDVLENIAEEMSEEVEEEMGLGDTESKGAERPQEESDATTTSVVELTVGNLSAMSSAHNNLKKKPPIAPIKTESLISDASPLESPMTVATGEIVKPTSMFKSWPKSK